MARRCKLFLVPEFERGTTVQEYRCDGTAVRAPWAAHGNAAERLQRQTRKLSLNSSQRTTRDGLRLESRTPQAVLRRTYGGAKNLQRFG